VGHLARSASAQKLLFDSISYNYQEEIGMDQNQLAAALNAAGLGRISADIEKFQLASVRLVSQAAGSQPLKG